MKKILATLLVGSVVVGGVVLVKGASAAATPEGKMCVRMAELCSVPEHAASSDPDVSIGGACGRDRECASGVCNWKLGRCTSLGAAGAACSRDSECASHLCNWKLETCVGGSSRSATDFDQCVDGMKSLRKLSGDASFEKSQKCLDEAQSCAAASGCMMGGVGVGTLGEMMKGFGNAVTK